MLERKIGPEPERIRQRAHALWEQEGRPEGRHDEHWARACRELEERDAFIQVTATHEEKVIEHISAEQPEETSAPLDDEVPLRGKLRSLPLNTMKAGYEYALAGGGKR